MRTNNANRLHAGHRADDPRATNRNPQGSGEQRRLAFDEETDQKSEIDFYWQAQSKAGREWRKKAKQIREGKRSSEGLHGQDSQDAKEKVDGRHRRHIA